MASLVDTRPKPIARRQILRVLIADNSLEDIRVVRELLRGDVDFRITAGRDSAEAIQRLAEDALDVALIDYDLWHEQGSEFVRLLREQHSDIAVVLLTSGENEREALPALRLGVQDFISKRGLDREQLTTRLIAAVEESRTGRRRETMVRWLEREARTDHLTGLNNRRAFDDRLREVCDAARLQHQPVTLVMVDVTGTHMVNETHGHEAGDTMIRRAAAGVAHCIRAIDFAARVGGDDFGVILPNAGLDLGKLMARRIAHEVDRLNTSEWIADVPVSLRFGVVSGTGCEPGELLAAGEAQLSTRKPTRAVFAPRPYREDSSGPSVA